MEDKSNFEEDCKYVGQTQRMKNGKMATIIEFRKPSDIDVQFDTGEIVRNVSYMKFYVGRISLTDYNATIERESIKNRRLGEIQTMNCGMEATIIEYRNFNDIDVKFEDGFIRKNVRYNMFSKGNIFHPCMKKENPLKNKRIGETRTMNCGMEAAIIEYRDCNDIDVKFIDGFIRKNVKYFYFKRGLISNPYKLKNKRIGETRTMNCGMKATIIEYRNSRDIDVKFEDGYVQKNRQYSHFKKGSINPYKLKNERIGETRTMNCGMKATIIEYRNSHDMDIKFENGVIRKGTNYYYFKNGLISNSKRSVVK